MMIDLKMTDDRTTRWIGLQAPSVEAADMIVREALHSLGYLPCRACKIVMPIERLSQIDQVCRDCSERIKDDERARELARATNERQAIVRGEINGHAADCSCDGCAEIRAEAAEDAYWESRHLEAKEQAER